MSIEGQGHFFTIYFPGFVCFVLDLAKISGERLQDHWSSGIIDCYPAGVSNTHCLLSFFSLQFEFAKYCTQESKIKCET